MTPRRTFLKTLPAVALPLGGDEAFGRSSIDTATVGPFVAYHDSSDPDHPERTIRPWYIFETVDNPDPCGGCIIVTTHADHDMPGFNAARYATEDRATINARWWQAILAANREETA